MLERLEELLKFDNDIKLFLEYVRLCRHYNKPIHEELLDSVLCALNKDVIKNHQYLLSINNIGGQIGYTDHFISDGKKIQKIDDVHTYFFKDMSIFKTDLIFPNLEEINFDNCIIHEPSIINNNQCGKMRLFGCQIYLTEPLVTKANVNVFMRNCCLHTYIELS